MAKKVKDTEYLMLSSMLRAREAGMLTRERMDRMLSAPSYQEAAKLLCDCGYEDMSACSLEGVNDALTRRRSEEDRRGLTISLTEAGRAQAPSDLGQDAAFSAMAEDERAMLKALLQKLLDSWEAEE